MSLVLKPTHISGLILIFLRNLIHFSHTKGFTQNTEAYIQAPLYSANILRMRFFTLNKKFAAFSGIPLKSAYASFHQQCKKRHQWWNNNNKENKVVKKYELRRETKATAAVGWIAGWSQRKQIYLRPHHIATRLNEMASILLPLLLRLHHHFSFFCSFVRKQ